MTDGPKLSTRSRVLRWALVALYVACALYLFPTWSTAAAMALVAFAWIGGTLFGFMLDEYFPRKAHSPREWTSGRIDHRGRFH